MTNIDTMMAAAPIVSQFHREAVDALRFVQSTEDKMNTKKFNRGDLVRKKSGSEWEGRVVGEYSTELTADGYAVESSAHKGSVQIYPAAALELVQPTEAGG